MLPILVCSIIILCRRQILIKNEYGEIISITAVDPFFARRRARVVLANRGQSPFAERDLSPSIVTEGRASVRISIINDVPFAMEYGDFAYEEARSIFDCANMLLEKELGKNSPIELKLIGVFNIIKSDMNFIGGIGSGAHGVVSDCVGDFCDENGWTDGVYRYRSALHRLSKFVDGVMLSAECGQFTLTCADIIVLLTFEDERPPVSGICHEGGAFSSDKCCIIVIFCERDSLIFKGSVLLHEIFHSLGARHDNKEDSLMQGCYKPTEEDRQKKIGPKTLEDISNFLREVGRIRGGEYL